MEYYVLIKKTHKHDAETWQTVLCEKNRTQNSTTLLVQLRDARLEKNTQK